MPREELRETSRIFIQGLGGSIKMDLQGIGIRFSSGVFAQRIEDDSLKAINVLPGDIALIEPVIRSFREGNLLLLDLDGKPALRRLSKKGRCWYLSSLDGCPSKTFVLLDHPFQGVVIGFLRLLNKLKPVGYRKPDTYFAPCSEVSSLSGRRTAARIKYESRSNPPAKSAKELAIQRLAARYPSKQLSKEKILLTEVDDTKGYKVDPERVDAHRWNKRSK